MIRESLAADAANLFAFFYQTASTYQTKRTSTGGTSSSQQLASSLSLPYWVKVERDGNTLTSYRSSDGVNWTLGATQTISMPQDIYIGLAVSSRVTSTLATATFDNVALTGGTTPYITGVSPSLGGFGTSVTIAGLSFGTSQGSSTVTFNGEPATTITSWSNSQIVASVPTGAPSGPGPVKVTVNSLESNGKTFNVINPIIDSLSPPNAQRGSIITINGSGFGSSQGASTVKFNGVTAAGVHSWSNTAISINVPSNAASGPVTVTVNGVVSNEVQFTVIMETLTVTGVSPAIGSVGTSVTITGTGFGATQSNSTIKFYDVPASVTSWGTSQIVAVVPAGAPTGPVGVTVASKSADGPTFFVTADVELTNGRSYETGYTSMQVGGKWYAKEATGPGCASCTLKREVSRTFDSKGNVLTETDALGRVTTYTYDSASNMLTESTTLNGNPVTTTYTYNSFGQVLTVTDPLGNVTTNTYDSKGNLTSVTTPAPDGSTPASVTQFAYNSLGQMTSITDPLNRVTTITYTSAGLIHTLTDPQNNVTTYEYDARGNRAAVVDAQNHRTEFVYDAMNRLTTITYHDQTTASFTYDSRGRRISATDQNGKTTAYTYDDADRLTKVTDAALNETEYAYDGEDNLISITDALGRVTSFTYDAHNRVEETIFPSTLIESYSYDAVGRMTSKTDRKAQTIIYTYDALDRLGTASLRRTGLWSATPTTP